MRYLKSLKAVHMVSVAKELCPEEEYTEIFNEFRASLTEMIRLKLATHTPKCHIAWGHFEQYFKLTGLTLYFANCSAVEAAHSLLRQSEEAHKTKTVHDHGSDNHLKRFKNSIVIFSFGPDNPDDDNIEFHELVTEESQAGEDQMDMTQFVAEEPQIPMRVQREVARLKRKVSEQEETIRALRAKLRRYDENDNNVI